MTSHPDVVVNDGSQKGTTDFLVTSTAIPYDRIADSADPQNDMDLEVDDIRTISDFLAKPVNVASGTFSAADAVNSTLYTSDILTLFNAQAIWLNKIQGYLNFRANVKFRLVINPTPFQAGMLRMSYLPCASIMPHFVNAHRYDRCTKSQNPGSYLNLNNNFCEVTVPYLAPTTFIERDASGKISWGSIFIDVFQTYRTGTGPASLNWSLWMSLEDTQLSGMVVPQMATGKRVGRTIDAEANDGRGPIAKIMSSGVKLANNLAAIPSLAPLATPASWVLTALGGAAEALGWSKPTISTGPEPMHVNVHQYANNVDSNDSCAPMSLRTDNRVSLITDASPGAMDEMSFNFLKKQWSFLKAYSWTSSDLVGATILAIQASPDNLINTYTIGGNSVETTASCIFPSYFFDNRRGSYEVRVSIVKTGFHTGALAFTWTPGLAAVTPSYSDTSYMYREIVDIQEGAEFIFNLPYLLPQDYASNSQFTGVFTAHVVNPLIAPATVASTIDLMFEIRGGDDLSFAAASSSLDKAPFVPQGLDNVDTDGVGSSIAMASTIHGLDNLHHASLANGENVQSFSDILRAAYTINFKTLFGPSSAGPFKIATGQVYSRRYNGITTTSPEMGGDAYSLIASCYAFKRGSTRYRWYNEDFSNSNSNFRSVMEVGNTPVIYSQDTTAGVFSWGRLLTASAIGGANAKSQRFIVSPPVNGGIAVQVPFYSRYRYLVNELITDDNLSAPAYTTATSIAFFKRGYVAGNFARSVGDDFQLSYFVGVPVLCNTDIWPNPS